MTAPPLTPEEEQSWRDNQDSLEHYPAASSLIGRLFATLDVARAEKERKSVSDGWVCPRCGRVHAPSVLECYKCNTGCPPRISFGACPHNNIISDSAGQHCAECGKPMAPPAPPAITCKEKRHEPAITDTAHQKKEGPA